MCPATSTDRNAGSGGISLTMLWLLALTLTLSVAPRDTPVPDPRFARADSLFRAGDIEDAVALMETVAADMAARGESPYEPLWRASSFALGLGVIEEAEHGATQGYARALDLARSARAADPDGLEARYWEVAALGRSALAAGPREASALAEEIRTRSLEILDRDPAHGGAHHALGKLYMEIMNLSGIARLVGRTIMGAAVLGEANWDAAERHLTRAVEAEPANLLFRLDLARLHAQRDRAPVARRILEDLARTGDPTTDTPPERVFRTEAGELLERVR